MRRKILFLSHAEEDIYTYAEYLAQNAGPEISKRFGGSIFESLDILSEGPYLGVIRDYSNSKLDGLRMWPVKNFSDQLIFYLMSDYEIIVVRVLHSSQDIENILSNNTIS